MRCALLLLFLITPALQAQVVSLPDTVVVTASREVEDARTTGRRVTVLTAADIERLPVSSLDELLRTAAGVDVLSRGPFGVQSDLTVRGATFEGVVLLVDGVRFNDPQTGHFLSDFPIPLSEIARVEVLRGPASSLYGPDALGGVIQVFTHTGLAAQERVEGIISGGTLALARGTHGLRESDFALRIGTRWTAFGVALSGAEADGERVPGVEGAPMSVRANFDREARTLAFRHRFDGANFFARLATDDRHFGAVRFYTPFPTDTAREATETRWFQVGLRAPDDARTRWGLTLGARQHKDVYTFNPQIEPNRHTSRQANVLASVSHPFGQRLTLGAGVSGLFRSIESNSLGTHDDLSGGAYAQLRWAPAPSLTVNASARLDHDPGFGTEVTPLVAVAYHLPLLTLRASGGRAVRAPSYTERYFNTLREDPVGNLGNPDLQAERAVSVEVGADVYPVPGLALHATAFTRTTDNLIDYARTDLTRNLFTAQNLLSVEARGLELEMNGGTDVGRSHMQFGLAYTYLDASLGAVDEGVEYKYALTSAQHLGQGTLGLRMGSVTAGVQSIVKQPLMGPRYSVHHVRVGWRVPLLGLELRTEVRNLFDARYTEVFAPMPGRWLVFGLKLGR